MKFFMTTLFILCHGICLAQDLPGGQKNSTSLTAEQAAELVLKANKSNQSLNLDRLTSIDREVAHELARLKGFSLSLKGLTSISKDVAHELAKFSPAPYPSKYLGLDGLTSCDRDVAHELAKFHG